MVNLEDGSEIVVQHLHTFSVFLDNVTLQICEAVVRGLQGVCETTAPLLNF